MVITSEATEGQPVSCQEWIEFACKAAREAEAIAREEQSSDPFPPIPKTHEVENTGFHKQLNHGIKTVREFNREEYRQWQQDVRDWHARNPREEREARAEQGLASRRQQVAAAFIASCPPMTNRANTKAFIACLAVGVQRRYITADDVKTLAYTAQLALTAHRPRARRVYPPTPRTIRGTR